MDFTISLLASFSFLARSHYPSYYRLSIVSSLYSNTSLDVLLAVCNLPSRINEHDETIEPIWSAKSAALVTDRGTVGGFSFSA